MTREEALIANKVQRLCLLEAGDDIEAALSAADTILAMRPFDYARWGLDASDLQSNEEWIGLPDSFLSLVPQESQVFLSTPAPVKQPDVIVHNHVAAPQITVNVPKMEPIFTVKVPEQKTPVIPAPIVNVAPSEITVNVPEQKAPTVTVESPTVNVAAPIVTIPPPNVTVQQIPAPDKRIAIRKDGAGQWTGEVRG